MSVNNPLFARAHAEITRVNADVVVMFAGDYESTNDDDDDDRDLENTCGVALGLLAEDAGESFAAVESVCVSAHSFTNVIGRLQGAGYNAENGTNTEFSYGHGYYHAGAGSRTVMSQSHDSCDDLGTSQETEVCTRQAIWSDPHRNFFGTTTPAGTAEDWNARVIFATAPHIASLRGGAQSYDSVGPTGNVTVLSPVPTSGAMQINATFSEPIHDWFPPTITITDGTVTTAATMTKISDTAYTYPHMLDGERGNVRLLLSDARDAFGNPVVKTPASGGTFAAGASAAPAQPPPPPGSVHTVNHDFQSKTTPNWRHTGDGTWLRLPPAVSVPDRDASTNRVVSSANCNDSCILTLRDTLDTTEPLTISLDRYVDAKADGDEGLYVEYSADGGTTWTVLASYTHRNGGDTDRWEKSVIGLSIPQNSAEFRLRAESDRSDERVEVDNLGIFRPAAVEPDASFTAVLNDALTSITITLSKNTSHVFSTSDFALSSGTVSSIQNQLNSTERTLQVAGIPGGTTVIVTYAGTSLDLGGGSVLNNGTAATAPPPSTSTYSVYVADTDDYEILAYSHTGQYQDDIVPRWSGGLGKPVDIAFGPSDGHMYVSDNTYKKIRKYNGTTGAPLGNTAASAEWASTVGVPNGMAWNGDTLYVATLSGVERISAAGTNLGYFGDASRNPPTSGAPALVSPYDVAFCPDGHMYVADRSLNTIIYYDNNTGKYKGAIPSTPSATQPDMRAASGLACGPAIAAASGTSLFQSGSDPGRINEISHSTKKLVRQYSVLVDEPHGVDNDAAGNLYVANKDDGNILKIFPNGTSAVFAYGALDGPRGVQVGPLYVPPPALPTVSISASGPAAITEGASAAFTISSTPPPTSPLSVIVRVSQHGSYTTDTGQRTVTIPTSGSTSLSVSTNNDSTDENNGSVTVDILQGFGYAISGPYGRATVTVNDNDAAPPPPSLPSVSVSSSQSRITEGSTATFTLAATPTPSAPLSINVQIRQFGNYLTNAPPATTVVTIPATGHTSLSLLTTDDNVDERRGSVTVTVLSGTGYAVSTTHSYRTISVYDNDVSQPRPGINPCLKFGICHALRDDSAPPPLPPKDADNDSPEIALLSDAGPVDFYLNTLPNSTSTLVAYATDPENDPVAFGVLPHAMPGESVSITDHQNDTATLSLDTGGMEQGTYAFTIVAFDGHNLEREIFTVRITDE